MKTPFLISCAAFLLAGCAYTSSSVVDYDDRSTKGFRYYEPKPILIIQGAEIKISFIPNYERGYAVRFHAFLAKNNVKLDFDNGLLTEMTSDMDTTALLTFLQAVGAEAVKQGDRVFDAFGEEPTAKVDTRIYEFVFSEDGRLVRLKRLKLE